MLFPPEAYVRYKGSLLPPYRIRFNSADHQIDDAYLNSSISEAERVVKALTYTPDQLIVDIGCGQGRLAIGLLRRFPDARYLGLDVSERSIKWCRTYLEQRHPSYKFQYLDVLNARYNPTGKPVSPGFRLPVPNGAADVVYMWGVVTNMEPEHMPVYIAEIARMLRAGGKAFCTANVEDDVPIATINPDNYVSFKCAAPLHIVRYEKRYFLSVFERVGLKMTGYVHHAVGNCQSEIYFIKE